MSAKKSKKEDSNILIKIRQIFKVLKAWKKKMRSQSRTPPQNTKLIVNQSRSPVFQKTTPKFKPQSNS